MEEITWRLFQMLRVRDNIPMPEDEVKAWSILADKMRTLIVVPERPSCFKEGQIWSTNNGDDVYMSPLVLILEVYDDNVRVAQVSASEQYFGEGDVRIKGDYSQFIETWNVYTVALPLIGNFIEEVSFDVFQSVITADVVRNFSSGYMFKFRHLEINVGASLSIQSLGMIDF